MKNLTADKIAFLVKRVRLKLNLSLGSMAKALGKSVATISYYERGQRIPPTEVLFWLLEKDGQITCDQIQCPLCNGTGTLVTNLNQQNND